MGIIVDMKHLLLKLLSNKTCISNDVSVVKQ